VNLNYEGKWVKNSRVLNLYEKKNYARNVFYRKVVERSYGNVKSSRKNYLKIVKQGWIGTMDMVQKGWHRRL